MSGRSFTAMSALAYACMRSRQPKQPPKKKGVPTKKGADERDQPVTEDAELSATTKVAPQTP